MVLVWFWGMNLDLYSWRGVWFWGNYVFGTEHAANAFIHTSVRISVHATTHVQSVFGQIVMVFVSGHTFLVPRSSYPVQYLAHHLHRVKHIIYSELN